MGYIGSGPTKFNTADGLTVTGDASFGDGVDVTNSAGATLKLTSTDTTGADTELLGQIDFVSSDSSAGSAGTQARIKGVYEDNGDSSGIAFLAGASTGSGTPTIAEVMRIRHEGNVGIGTASPDALLEIKSASNTTLRLFNTGTNYFDIENDSNLKFNRGGSELLRIQANGGISFNGDTAAANALDDYEEGTFTFNVGYNPDATANNASGSTKVDAATAHYTKIGNQCTVYYPSVTLSTLGLGTTACLVGSYELPFAAASGANSSTQISGYLTTGIYANTPFQAQLTGYIAGGYTTIFFNAYSTTAGGGSGHLKLVNGGNILFVSITYKVS